MSDNTYTGFHVQWIEEWSQFFQSCNWYTFHPLLIEFEDERSMGGVEIAIIVLGLGFRLRWNHTETDEVKEIMARVERIRSEQP